MNLIRCRTFLFSVLAAVLIAGLITACQKPVVIDVPARPFSPLLLPADGKIYRVLSTQSELRVKVYRQGSMAALGHNHVVSSAGLEGEVYLSADLLTSVVEVRLPVSLLEVDRPELRQDEGEDFPGELEQSAIDGTRANMLGEQQLDATNWPWIVLRGRKLSGQYPEFTLQADMLVQGSVVAVEIPLQVEIDGVRLHVVGEFSLLQTELGLEPFSVMMGALRVRDQLDIELDLVAIAD